MYHNIEKINMAIPFTRSTRSMNNDSYLPGLVAVVSLSLVLLMWLVWFLTWPLPVTVSSSQYTIRADDGMLLVNFPPESLNQVRPGQRAELILTRNGSEGKPIVGEVMNLPEKPTDPLQIFLFNSDPPEKLQDGKVAIVINETTPAMLLFQSMQANSGR